MAGLTVAIMDMPQIRRSREYHLYDFAGKRYLDLFLDDGRALLGHRPPGIPLELKNTFSKGLCAPYPSVYEQRFYRGLGVLFPEYDDFRVYRNLERVRMIFHEHGITGTGRGISNPPFDSPGKNMAAFWRPFLPEPEGKAYSLPGNPGYVIPVLPCPGNFYPVPVCVKKKEGNDLPRSDSVSPALLSALTRSIYELEKFSRQYNEDLWKRFPAPFWERKGPYLLLRQGNELPELFRKCLGNGILIPPDDRSPGIIPASWTEGEVTFLQENLEG